MLNEGGIDMYNYLTLKQIEPDFCVYLQDYIVAPQYHQNPSKSSIRNLHVSFLQAIPGKEMTYFNHYEDEPTMKEVLEEQGVEENASVIMRAYKKPVRPVSIMGRHQRLKGPDKLSHNSLISS